MKRNRSKLARTLDRPAVIEVPRQMDTARDLERWFARAVLLAFAALAIAILAACETTNTQMKGVWVSPDKGRAPIQSVLVIGINRDATARRVYEDAIVAQLAARGIKARASYNLLPELGPVPPSVHTVENVDVESQLFDAKQLALVWSGSSTTQPSSSMQQTIGDFAKLLVKALADAKVIA